MTLDDYFQVHYQICHAWIAFLGRNHSDMSVPHRLGIRALRICYFIWKHPDCPLKEVAGAVSISRATTSQLVDSLCRQKLLQREWSESDRRRIQLSTMRNTGTFLAHLEKRLAEIGPLPPLGARIRTGGDAIPRRLEN